MCFYTTKEITRSWEQENGKLKYVLHKERVSERKASSCLISLLYWHYYSTNVYHSKSNLKECCTKKTYFWLKSTFRLFYLCFRFYTKQNKKKTTKQLETVHILCIYLCCANNLFNCKRWSLNWEWKRHIDSNNPRKKQTL